MFKMKFGKGLKMSYEIFFAKTIGGKLVFKINRT